MRVKNLHNQGRKLYEGYEITLAFILQIFPLSTVIAHVVNSIKVY